MIRFWKTIHKRLTTAGQIESETDIKDDLQMRYKSFLDLLTENEQSLDLMTELENKYYNQQLISIPYLKSMIKNLSRRIGNILFDLQALSGNSYNDLFQNFEDITKKIRRITTGGDDPIYTPVIIPMDKITTKYIDKVGSKMANLGELKNECNLNIPDGFGLTVCAYTHFSEFNSLSEKIFNILHKTDVSKSHELFSAEAKIKALIKNAQVPSEIAEIIRKQSEKIENKHDKPIYWAVRSSAIGEDLEDSFAGQFSSILNVPTAQLIDQYKAVAASKYNTRSILYQRMKNIHSDDVNMSVGFLEMVDARCSGVLYTTDPVHPDNQEMVISAIWGLGQLLVEGDISADTYILARNPDFSLLRQEIVPKKIFLKLAGNGGTKHGIVPEGQKNSPCLNRNKLRKLGQAAMVIEKHFKCAQDIEWCFDKNDNLIIVQARPLHLNTGKNIPTKKVNASVISDKAKPVAAGTGAGKVFKAEDIHDLFGFPRGGILVLKNSSPQYTGVFQKASAVVVEKGNLTDHMSSVVREFHVPCVVRVPDIFSILKNNDEITVDATNGIIYQGIIKAILNDNSESTDSIAVNVEDTESYQMLERLAELIFPLNLTDPRGENLTENSCKSWHDIIRFCHETALNEMFSLKDKNSFGKMQNIYQVDTKLSLNLYLLDLFDNSVITPHEKLIKAESIICKPFQALWLGMNASDVSPDGYEKMDGASGVITAKMRTPALESANSDTKSFAVVTKEYLNLSLSMGYHYVALDSYMSKDPYLNHITISFKGGTADARKRNLRVLLISEILKKAGFKVNINKDFLKARLKAEDADIIERNLFLAGKMFGMTRLLDLSLEDETSVEFYLKKFYEHTDLDSFK